MHMHSHTPLQQINAAGAFINIPTVGLITLSRYTLSSQPFHFSPIPCLLFFSISGVYSTSDPWIIPWVNCVWCLQPLPLSSSRSIISPPSRSLFFLHFTFNYQTATTKHVKGRIKHRQPGKHTRPYIGHKMGFIHLCMPHLSVPIVCIIPWENVCRRTGGIEFQHTDTHACTP